LMRGLRGRFSGLCQPTYVLDIPDGHGKSPIGPNYVSASDAGKSDAGATTLIEDYTGRRHAYPPKS